MMPPLAKGLVDAKGVALLREWIQQMNTAPTAVVSSDVISGNTPLTVDFTGSDSTDDYGIVSFQWDFGDGNGSSEPNPTHTYTISGVYMATLLVTDAIGLQDSNSITITVNAPNGEPNAVAKADTTSGEAPMTVNFVGSDSTDDNGIVSYEWDFADGETSLETDPSHEFISEGSYQVTLTVTDAQGLQDSESITITVNAPNSAPDAIAEADTTSGEAPMTVNFVGNDSTDDNGIVSYEWDFADGETSLETDPSHEFISEGSYQVTLTVTDAQGLQDTDSIVITVNAQNGAPVAIASAYSLSGDAPLTIGFTGSDSTDDKGIESYFWDFGDGNTSQEADPLHTFQTVGTYQTSLTVTDADGLQDSTTLIVTVQIQNEGPTAIITSDVMSGVAPLTINFMGSAIANSGIETYFWDFGDGATSENANTSHIFEIPGTYQVTLLVIDEQGREDNESLTITVLDSNEPPTAIATADILSGDAPLTVRFEGSKSTDDNGIESYFWDFGDDETSTLPDPEHMFTNSGTYQVILTVTDNKGLQDTDMVTIVSNETNESLEVIDFNIIMAPNPTTNFIELTVVGSQSSNGLKSILIHDTTGRLIQNYNPNNLKKANNVYEVPLYGLTDETYFITVLVDVEKPISKRILLRN